MEIGVRRVGTVWCDVERLGLACVELWWRRGFAAVGDGGGEQRARAALWQNQFELYQFKCTKHLKALQPI